MLTLEELVEHDGFRAIAMTQRIERDGLSLTTTRSPIRIDGERLTDPRPAPALGEHNPTAGPTAPHLAPGPGERGAVDVERT